MIRRLLVQAFVVVFAVVGVAMPVAADDAELPDDPIEWAEGNGWCTDTVCFRISCNADWLSRPYVMVEWIVDASGPNKPVLALERIPISLAMGSATDLLPLSTSTKNGDYTYEDYDVACGNVYMYRLIQLMPDGSKVPVLQGEEYMDGALEIGPSAYFPDDDEVMFATFLPMTVKSGG